MTARPETEIATSVEDRIRARAYEIWIRNGYRDGCEVEDWVEAEREVRGAAAPRSMSSAA